MSEPLRIPREASGRWLRVNTRICTTCHERKLLRSFNQDYPNRRRCSKCHREHVPMPFEARASTQKVMRVSLAFARALIETPRHGLTTGEIAARLEVSAKHVCRLGKAAELAGWPIVKIRESASAEWRWRLALG